MYIDSPTGSPGSPVDRIQSVGADFDQAFREHHAAEQSRMRYATLRRAADLALGNNAADWFRRLGVGVDDEYARVLGNDATLIKRLEELEGDYMRRTGKSDGAAERVIMQVGMRS